MRKSFRVFLFFQILLATALILFANRQLAQHYLVKQMEARAHQELIRILDQCESQMTSEESWNKCNKGERKGDVLNPLNELFVPCARQPTDWQAAECSRLRAADMTWQKDEKNDEEGVDAAALAKGRIDGQLWHVASRDHTARTPAVLLSDASLWHYLKNVWSLRDRNLIYVLPTVILMLVLLTAYMVYVVMRPIRLLEKTLSTLDFKNIREKSTIEVPYREFKTLANVYRDLLNRLYESYENAKRFASDAAHELKTPLSILRGNVERLIPETQHGTAVQGYVQNLSDEVDRLVLITEKLLMLSRADSNNLALDLTPFNLSVFLNELIEDASTFHPHLQFINHVQPDVVWRCDHALIEQLINNLYTNAVKYNTPRGGWIAIHLQQTDTDIVLQFKNSSADVSPELPQKAFERFYRSDASRTRRKVDGLGLGLSICKEIAQAHGGTMQLTVEDDHVVSIELRAPLQPAHP
ncbi:MAG: hypothetical protein RLZZ24_874 [Pseudomonadota bacterium]